MDKENKKFLKNFIWNLLGTGLNSFSSLFFLIIITRVNGIEEAGIFSIGIAIAMIIYTVALYSGRLCQVTDIKNKTTDKEYIVNRVITCFIAFVISIVIVLFRGYTEEKFIIILLLCLFKILEAFDDILYGIMQKNEMLYKVGKSLFLKSLLGILGLLITILLIKNLIISLCILNLINVLNILFFDKPIIDKLKNNFKNEKISFSNVWKILKSEFFVFANSFAGIYILNASKYAIDVYSVESIQAIFGYIMMPATVMSLFAQFILLPFLNKFKELYEHKKIKDLNKLGYKIKGFVIAFGIFAVSIAYLIGTQVLTLIYGVELEGYRIQLVSIIASYILYAISYINLVLLTTIRKTFIQFIIYLICMIVAFIGSNILVKTYGISGATGSTALTLGIQFILYVIITQIELKTIDKKLSIKIEN